MATCNVEILDEIRHLAESKCGEYNEIGFKFNHMWITNPFYDESGVLPVNPIDYYGQTNIDIIVKKFKEAVRV